MVHCCNELKKKNTKKPNIDCLAMPHKPLRTSGSREQYKGTELIISHRTTLIKTFLDNGTSWIIIIRRWSSL